MQQQELYAKKDENAEKEIFEEFHSDVIMIEETKESVVNVENFAIESEQINTEVASFIEIQ